MITVNKFQVSADMKTLLVKVTAAPASRITSFTIQTDQTYLDTSVDLVAKLSLTSEINEFTLAPSDLNISSFNGIYFATFGTDEMLDDEARVANVVVAACNFSQFFYCINDSLASIDGDCLTCNDKLQNTLIMDLYLEGLKNALIVSKYTNAITNFYALRKLCAGSIDGCLTGCTSGYGVLDGAFVLS